ncbi:MAG: J domain-containing protein [Abditibacteriota bacterium]|nr:J domain-containing protein [Abditibacteriota bacterium]
MNTLMAVQNYYKVLGLDPKATNSEIKTSYHKLARLYHPDLHKGNRYHNMFIAINQAYSVLRDENSRKAYDFLLREQEEANKPTLTYGNFNPSTISVEEEKPKETVETPKVTYKRAYNPKEFNMHFETAKKAYDEKAFVDAMNEINVALEMNPKSFMAHELKGDIYIVYKNYFEALKEFELSFKYNKKNTDLQDKIELCHEKLKPKKQTFLSRLKRKLFEDPDA